MSDANLRSEGAEQSPIASIKDTDSAATALESLLFPPEVPVKEAPQAEAPADETPQETPAEPAPEETPASDATEDTRQSEPAQPVIEPPVSWNADQKAEFAKLPVEAQKIISARESERERAINQRLQETAERQKALEAEKQTAANERAQLAQRIQAITLSLVPELQKYANVDWAALARQDQQAYIVAQAEYQQLQQRFAMAQQAAGELQAKAQQEVQEQNKQRLLTERQKMIEKIPEAADRVKWNELAREIHGYLANEGFTAEELNAIGDHRLVAVARKAALWEKSQKALQSAQAKKVVAPPPKVQKPGTSQGRDDGKAKEVAALRTQLSKSGRDRDAAALLEHIL